MTKIKLQPKKIDNQLKSLIQRLAGPNGQRTRVDYAQAVVDHLAEKKNGKHSITRNQVYLLVNNYSRVTSRNIFIARAVKVVVNQLLAEQESVKKELAELAD